MRRSLPAGGPVPKFVTQTRLQPSGPCLSVLTISPGFGLPEAWSIAHLIPSTLELRDWFMANDGYEAKKHMIGDLVGNPHFIFGSSTHLESIRKSAMIAVAQFSYSIADANRRFGIKTRKHEEKLRLLHLHAQRMLEGIGLVPTLHSRRD